MGLYGVSACLGLDELGDDASERHRGAMVRSTRFRKRTDVIGKVHGLITEMTRGVHSQLLR